MSIDRKQRVVIAATARTHILLLFSWFSLLLIHQYRMDFTATNSICRGYSFIHNNVLLSQALKNHNLHLLVSVPFFKIKINRYCHHSPLPTEPSFLSPDRGITMTRVVEVVKTNGILLGKSVSDVAQTALHSDGNPVEVNDIQRSGSYTFWYNFCPLAFFRLEGEQMVLWTSF